MANAISWLGYLNAWNEAGYIVQDDTDDHSDDTSTTGTVTVGGSVTGDLEADGDRDWFAVTLQAGRTYRIDLEGSETDKGTLSDPNLRGIYDASGVLIKGTSNDDGGDGLNSRVRFTPDEDGTYYVSAGAFVGGTGTYTLSVTEVTDDFADDSTTTGKVAVGGSVQGEIEEARDRDWFAVELEVGRAYRFDLEGSDTDQGTLGDPYLLGIYDASGDREWFGDNDDGVGHNSRTTFTPGEDGTYFVSVSGAPVGETGTYTLFVKEDVDDFSADTSTTGEVEVGGSIQGELGEPEDIDWISVRLEAGHSYWINFHSAYLSLYSDAPIGFYDANGVRILGAPIRGTDVETHVARVLFVPEEDAIYYVALQNLAANPYTLSVEELTDDFSADTSTTGRVSVAGSVTGELEHRGDQDWFAVTLQAGKDYVVDLEGGTLRDPVLFGIYDADGVQISHTYNDDGGEGSNSRLSFTPTVNGTYYVSAAANSSTYYYNAGTYTLTVTEGTDDFANGTSTTGRVVVGGSVVGELEQRGDEDWFAVTLVAGNAYVIDIEGTYTGKGTLNDPYLRGVYDADGVLISGSWNDNGGVGRNSRSVLTPDENGTYYISVESAFYFGIGTGTYVLSVQEGTDDFSSDTSTTGRVSVGGSVTGELELYGDHDWFAVTLEAGKSYVIDLEGSENGRGTLADPYLEGVYDSSGDRISGTGNNDSGIKDNSRVIFSPEEDGTYYVAAAASRYSEAIGTYTLSVEEVRELDAEAMADTGDNSEMPVAIGYLFEDAMDNTGDGDQALFPSLAGLSKEEYLRFPLVETDSYEQFLVEDETDIPVVEPASVDPVVATPAAAEACPAVSWLDEGNLSPLDYELQLTEWLGLDWSSPDVDDFLM